LILLLTILFSVLISAQDFNSEIEKYLNQKLNNYDNIQFTILSELKPAKYEIDFSRELKVKNNIAYLPVQITEKNKTVNSILTLQLKLFKLVPVASREIKRREIFDDKSLVLQMVDISSLGSRSIDVKELTKSMRARTLIKQGEVITRELVEEIPLVQSGSRVIAECIKGSVAISTEVIAREDGKLNEVIDVLTTSNELLKAKVINSQKVLIE